MKLKVKIVVTDEAGKVVEWADTVDIATTEDGRPIRSIGSIHFEFTGSVDDPPDPQE